MTKELFVSSTPHETKVGLVEDDLLAEIYLERENEYTLAGSIYKGRVTRVLPGMQSAFVDIGLERDAFLYVSDFMELEDAEDLDDVPTNRPVTERQAPQDTVDQLEARSVRPHVAEAQTEEPAHSEGGHTEPSRILGASRAREKRRNARQAPPPRASRRALSRIEICSSGDGRAARSFASRSSGTQ